MIPVLPKIDWLVLMPVLTVIGTGVAALFVEMFWPRKNNGPLVGVSLIGLTLAAWQTLSQFGMKPASTFADMMLRDQLSLVLQLLLIATCFIAFLFSEGYLREKKIAFAEFYPLALWSTAGGMLMVTTTNLLEMFLGLEVLSIALYCLAGTSRQESKSEESALKYFLLGAFASAFFLMGVAYIFGATGSLDMGRIVQVADFFQAEIGGPLVFGVMMVLIGLGFKAALVPFHQWTPDVYQGAPTNVTAFMAAASKIAAFGALIRFLEAVSPLHGYWMPVMMWVAVLTMTVGNLASLVQKDVKRVLGYSSIANAGYILVAVLAHVKAPDRIGLSTVYYYLLAYSLMTLGAFAVVSLAVKGGKEGTRFQDLNGLWKRAPLAVACLVVFVASLIGIPPTAGFIGKLQIFMDSLAADLPVLAVVLAVNSVISVFYYLRILQAAFVDDEGFRKNLSMKPGFGVTVAVVSCAVGVFWASLAATPLQKTLKGDEVLPQPVAARSRPL